MRHCHNKEKENLLKEKRQKPLQQESVNMYHVCVVFEYRDNQKSGTEKMININDG
jgi:hypothetical protein